MVATAQQDRQLADQYFNNGEYEKALKLYDGLAKDQPTVEYYFSRSVDCYVKLLQFDKAIEVIEKQIKRDAKKPQHYATLGGVYLKQNKLDLAGVQFEKAIERLTADRGLVYQIASQFVQLGELDFALRTYERGADLMKDRTSFATQMGDLYMQRDNIPKMIVVYLDAIKDNANMLSGIQATLQRQMTEDIGNELQTQLLQRINDEPKNAAWPDLLAWLYMQRRDYRNAFRQLKSLDRMLSEDGSRVYAMADIAFQAQDWDAAITGFEYIATEKGSESPYFYESKHQLLTARRNKVVNGFSYTPADLVILESNYRSFIAEIGLNRNSAPIIADLARLYGRYMNNLDSAIALLNTVVAIPGIDRNLKAQSKLDLGDFYLIADDPWEATLLYAQVDKEFKDDALGQEARYRNARLSYFKGDFEWARTQFDVLKSGTSKLISNDAIDMSVFIMDNTGTDSITEPLELFAAAELLLFQNKFDAVLSKLQDIRTVYPKHNLADDVLYLEAQMYDQRRMYVEAARTYLALAEQYKESIRADNSLYRTAELYDGPLADKTKARELYEKIFTEYAPSTFAVEARRRYRIMRGDKVQ